VPRSPNPMRRWAILFGLLLCVITAAADAGLLGFLRRIHDIPLADKLAHFMLYGLLNLLTIRAVRESRPATATLGIAASCSLLLAAAAALEEASQLYIATRTFSTWDLGAGIAGIVAFGAWAGVIDRRARGPQGG